MLLIEQAILPESPRRQLRISGMGRKVGGYTLERVFRQCKSFRKLLITKYLSASNSRIKRFIFVFYVGR